MAKRYDRNPQTGKRYHSYVPEMADDLGKGKVTRRDFLHTATLLGVSYGVATAMADDILGKSPAKPQAANAATPKKGGVLSAEQRVQRMDDPAIYDWIERSNQTRGICEHLTRTDEENITHPYMMESWEASEDLKTWTLNLQKGIKWSNGDDFNADDVVFNMERWQDPDVGSSNAGLFSAQESVEKIDDHTVRLNLKTPVLSIPENFYNYPTAMLHRRFSDEGGDLSKNPVGTGPYTLVELRVGEICELRRRTDPHGYWARDPYLDGITYRDYGDDPQPRINAFIAGEVDTLYEVAVKSLDVVEKIPDAELLSVTTAQTGIGRYRVTEAPFDNKTLRMAFNACLDHDEILKVAYRGQGTIAENHHVAPIHPEYAKLPMMKRDIEKAKALMAEAGYADGIDLKIDFNANDDWHRAALTTVKQQVAPAGIRLEINSMPGGTYWDVWDTTPFGFTQWTHRPLGVMVLNLAYRSGVPWNEAAYANPTFDKELDVASGILDVGERSKQMEVVQKILQDDAVFFQPLWRGVFTIGRKGKLMGRKAHPTLYHQFQNWWLA